MKMLKFCTCIIPRQISKIFIVDTRSIISRTNLREILFLLRSHDPYLDLWKTYVGRGLRKTLHPTKKEIPVCHKCVSSSECLTTRMRDLPYTPTSSYSAFHCVKSIESNPCKSVAYLKWKHGSSEVCQWIKYCASSDCGSYTKFLSRYSGNLLR